MPPFTSTAPSESLRGRRVRVADDVGPDVAARERPPDHLAVHFVVEREQRLVLREGEAYSRKPATAVMEATGTGGG